MKADYYSLLDLRSNATAADIKKKFRELAKRYHPDRNPDNADAEERFKLINEAYAQLRDPEKRADYDRILNRLQHKKKPQQSAAWYDDFHPVDQELRDFLQGFYKARSAIEGQRSSLEADVRFNLKVDFREAALGCVKEIRLLGSLGCPRCGGSGIPAAARQQRCTQCHGTGRNPAYAGLRKKCEACKGTGKVYLDSCRRCKGSGKVESYRAIQVNIPPGIETGTRLHLKGLGRRNREGGKAGDFFVVVQVTKHPLIQLEDGRLVCRVPVPVYQALTGAEIEVPTLDGSMSVTVPPGARTGQEIRLRGQGLRLPERKRRGDLIIRLEIEMPKKITAAEKKLLQQLADKAAAASYPQSRKYERALSTFQRQFSKKDA
jgi:molecular chaperone DnaJ